MTRAPKEKPTSVRGLAPRFRSINESARMRPAAFARPMETVHGLSIRYESFDKMMGSWSEAIRATRMVLPRTCCSP